MNDEQTLLLALGVAAEVTSYIVKGVALLVDSDYRQLPTKKKISVLLPTPLEFIYFSKNKLNDEK